MLMGLAIVATALGVARIAVPAARHLAVRRAALDARAQLLARSRAVVAQEAALREALEASLLDVAATADVLIPGETSAAAAAELATIVTEAAGVVGLRLTQVTPVAMLPREPVAVVELRLGAEGDLPAVVRFLEDLERGGTIVSVPELSIRERGGAASATEGLVVRMTVMGYYRSQGG